MSQSEFYKNFAYLPVPETVKNVFLDKDGIELKRVGPLNRINIFVGENNSGKSWLLRELLKAEYGEYFYKDEKIENLKTKIEELKSFILESRSELNNSLIGSTDAFDSAYRSIETSILNETLNFKSVSKFYSDLIELKKQLDSEIEGGDGQPSAFNQLTAVVEQETYSTFRNNIITKISDLQSYMETEFVLPTQQDKLLKIFIPTHRTLSTNLLERDRAYNFLKTSYNMDIIEYTNKEKFEAIPSHSLKENNFISGIFGFEIFYNIKNLLLTDSISRDKLRDFENFISNHFYPGQRVSITPSELDGEIGSNQFTNGYIKIKIGDDKDFKIHDLGTGLQMLIILTWPLFYYDSGMIFIEEPELYLHPTFQNQFIDIIANEERAKNFQFFIATHSNHIIDAINNTDKINLFTLEKRTHETNNKNHIYWEQIEFGNLMPYELLGVRSSSLALANCIIWVEGPSDRIYIKKWLDLQANNELVEGLHYQILFYGGSLVSHFSFENLSADQSFLKDFIEIIKINHKAIFVADSDKEKETSKLKKEVIRIRNAFSNPKDCVWITKGRTIENYLTGEIVNKVFSNVSVIPAINQYEEIAKYFKKIKRLGVSKVYKKVEFAKKITENLAQDDLSNYLDLTDTLDGIIKKIKEWNGIKTETAN